MSDLGASTWSESDAANTAAVPNGWPEGMQPSGVNNSARAEMGGVKRFWNRTNSVKTSAGSATVYTLTYDVAAAQYYDGEEFAFVVDETCGAAPTLNINGIGARQIRKFVAGAYSNLLAGDIVANQQVRVRYNLANTTFDIVSSSAFVAAGGGTWTPTDNSVAGLSFTNVSAKYQVIGNMVYAYARLTYPTTSNGASASIGGLPLTVPNQTYALISALVQTSGGSPPIMLTPAQNATTANFVNLSTGAALTNANMSTLTPNFCLIYPAS